MSAKSEMEEALKRICDATVFIIGIGLDENAEQKKIKARLQLKDAQSGLENAVREIHVGEGELARAELNQQ